MGAYILYGIVIVLTFLVYWVNRKDFNDSFKIGETGYSSRKLIAFQLMLAVAAGDTVYIYKFYLGTPWAEKSFIEWWNYHLLYVMFVLGFLLFNQVIKLVSIIRGIPYKEEPPPDTPTTASGDKPPEK